MTSDESLAALTVAEEEDKLRSGFDNMDSVIVSSLSDAQLARLQSERKRDSAQFIFADREWQRRLIERQLRNQRYVAWVGGVCGLAGVFIGLIAKYFFK